MEKNIRLFNSSYRRGALLLHGLASSSFEMSSLANFLFKNKWNVNAPLILDLYNHEKTNFLNLRWQEALKNATEELSFFKEMPVFIIGTSFGGIIAVLLAIDNPSIKGIVVANPPFDFKNIFLKLVLKLQLPIKGFKTKPPKEHRDEYFPYFPFKGLKEIQKASKEAAKNFQKIYQPILVFYSIKDRSISFKGIEKFLNNINSEIKIIEKLSDAPHSVFSPYYKNNFLIFEKVLSFLNKSINL